MMKNTWTVGLCAAGALFGTALTLISAAGPLQSPTPPQSPPTTGPSASTPAMHVSAARGLLDRHCVGCHNTRTKTGDLSLSAADADPDRVGDDLEVWEKVARKLRARAMPPAGPGPRMPDEAYEGLITHLETRLDRHALEHPDPGPTEKFRRLNRTEFQNAVRDLLDLDVDAASLLPTDDSNQGFDNVNVSGVSPTLLDRYLSAAQKIARLAVGRVVGAASAHTVVLPIDLTQDDWLNGLPFGTRGGTVFSHTFPADGVYRFDVRLTRDRDERIEGSHHEQLDLLLDGRPLQSFSLTPRKEGSAQSLSTFTDATAETDAGLTVRTPVTAGAHEITVTFQKASAALMESERQPYKANYTYRSRAAVFSVTVSGPFDVSGPGDTPSRRRIFVCQPSSAAEEPACAATVLSRLARRAYRRPVTDADVQPLLSFYSRARADGERFEGGVEMALRALLVSPGFLFRAESASAPSAATVDRVSDIDLASRLSFFIWSSIPDDALLDVAVAGRLGNLGELERQVRRMLADRRSDALIHSFADQWLFLRNVDTVTRDLRLYPDFDDNLRQAFKRETQMLFESILREDRSVLDLLRADYTFINERLARHYGIPGVYGSHFRRVSLGPDSVRRGLLGHASVLTVTSYANRTSPVQRGMWVLANILGMHVPPAPVDVPPLKEDEGERKVLTMRERMAVHRANPTCATCHRLMDPIGLAFENFDAVGQWRTHESLAGEPVGEPIDASGGLPDGSAFEGVAAMREALLRHGDIFAVTVTEKLLVYALGRGLEPADASAVRTIVNGSARHEHRFSDMIMGVVTSTPFRMRRSE
jgi:mono/diheme cytochrome c family protein